jgi:hypothetical protein
MPLTSERSPEISAPAFAAPSSSQSLTQRACGCSGAVDFSQMPRVGAAIGCYLGVANSVPEWSRRVAAAVIGFLHCPLRGRLFALRENRAARQCVITPRSGCNVRVALLK